MNMEYTRRRTETASGGVVASHPRRLFVDLHCHCLPGLDDGPRSHEEALALCRSLAEDNIAVVVATPHQLGRFAGRTGPEVVRRATTQLNNRLAGAGINLDVTPGGEVRLDERVGALLAADGILTLADRRRHLLLEVPEEAFIDIEPVIAEVAGQGMNLILAHPERNTALMAHPQAMWRWLNCGVSLQLTAGSLAGHWGREVKQNAWRLLDAGWAAIIATDAHDCSAAGPCMTIAFEMVRGRLGAPIAHLLCCCNPWRVLQGERICPPVFCQTQEAKW
jgi:protein-tyrosine phosphatase